YGSTFSFWALIFQNPNAVSFLELQSVLEKLQARGFDPAYSVFLSDFVNAMVEQGHAQEAAKLIDARLAGDAAKGQLWNAPELMRIKSRTLLNKPSQRASTSEIWQQALSLARTQQAKAWERRLT